MFILNKRQIEDIEFSANEGSLFFEKQQILDLLETSTVLEVDYQYLKTIYYLQLAEDLYLKIVETEAIQKDGTIEGLRLYGVYANTLTSLRSGE